MLEQVVASAIFPGLSGGLLILVAVICHRRGCVGVPTSAGWAIATGLFAALILSFLSEAGRAALSFTERWHQLLALGAIVAVIGIAADCWRNWLFRALATMGCGLIGAILLAVPGFDSTAWRLGLGLLIAASVVFLLAGMSRAPAWVSALNVCMVLSAMSFMVLQAHFAKLSLICGALAACCGFGSLVMIWRRNLIAGAGAAIVLGTMLPGIALVGHAYNQTAFNILPWVLVLCGAALPGLIWLFPRRPLTARRAAWFSAASFAVTIALCMTAVAVTKFQVADDSMTDPDAEEWEEFYRGL